MSSCRRCPDSRSRSPSRRPASVNRIADAVAGAVGELGYDRYTVSGGDVGGDVAEVLAAGHPDRVTALHLTNVSPRHAAAADPARLPPEAAGYLGRAAQWFRSEGGYIAEQSTRPGTLTAALADSPAGLAAWIAEKLAAWSDDAPAAFTRDEILTWVTAYWLTGSIGTSFSTYAEPAAIPDRIDTPTVLSAFPPRHQTRATQLREGLRRRPRVHRARRRRPLRRMGTARGLRRRPAPRRATGRAKRAGRVAGTRLSQAMARSLLTAEDPRPPGLRDALALVK